MRLDVLPAGESVTLEHVLDQILFIDTFSVIVFAVLKQVKR